MIAWFSFYLCITLRYLDIKITLLTLGLFFNLKNRIVRLAVGSILTPVVN